MVNVAGYKTRVLVGEFDYSGFATGTSTDRDRNLIDVSTFRPAAVDDPDRAYISGLGGGTVTIEGLLDEAAGASGPQTDTLMSGALQVVTISHQGANTIGDRALVAHVRQTDSPITAPVDGAITLSTGRQGSAAFAGGVILKEFDQESSTGNLASVNNGASSAFGSVANLHVTQFSGTDIIIKVADSTDDAIFADHITFTTVTAATSERGTATGTVNQYARIEITGTFTTCTFAVSFARLLQ